MNFKKTKFRVYCKKCDSVNVEYFIIPFDKETAVIKIKCNFCGEEEEL